MGLRKKIGWLLAVAVISDICPAVHALTIAQDGTNTAVIVVDKEASLPQQHE